VRTGEGRVEMSVDGTLAPRVGLAATRATALTVAVVAVLGTAVIAVAAIYPFVSPLRESVVNPLPPTVAASEVVAGIAWMLVLLVSLVRDPRGRLWKLILLLLIADRIDTLGYVPDSLVWSVARVTDALGVPVAVWLVLAYPSGRLRTRYDRGVVAFVWLVYAAWVLKEVVLAGDWWALGCAPDCVHNLIVIAPDPELHELATNGILVILAAVVAPLLLIGLWRHWRAAGAAGRRTLLPVVAAISVWAGFQMADALGGAFELQPVMAFFSGPSGTIIHAIAPSLLPLGILLVTVLVMWRRTRIADLVVELGRGVPVGGLRDVLARTLGDPSLQLAFAAPSGSGFVDAAGLPVELPNAGSSRQVTRLERDGDLLGVLVHDPAIEADEPGLTDAVGNAAGLALENERLAAQVRAQLEEVRASRTRIVEAADAERRRVERDLHDGAQQRLVALALRLQVAKQTMSGGASLLDEATAELQTAIGEVRGLARGVHPTILTEAGLGAAVEALAERTPVPVVIDVPDRRFSSRVEAAAYFVVAEALTNVSRYAEAHEVRVRIAAEADRLIVTVTDDGVGGADPASGSGLRGLDDRVSAIGGTFAIASAVGSGTSVVADLPLEPAPIAEPTAPGPAAERAADMSPVAVGAASVDASADLAIPAMRAARPLRALATRAWAALASRPLAAIVGLAVLVGAVAVAAAYPGAEGRGSGPQLAEAFARPFLYRVPPDSQVRMRAYSDHLNVLWRPGQGLSIWVVEDVLADPCKPDGPVAARAPGADGLVAYLRSVKALTVIGQHSATVDGRPATAMTLITLDSGCDGGPLMLWRDAGSDSLQAIRIPGVELVPITIVDVDGATVVIEDWGGPEDGWKPIAGEIMRSLRFFNGPAADTRVPTGQSGARLTITLAPATCTLTGAADDIQPGPLDLVAVNQSGRSGRVDMWRIADGHTFEELSTRVGMEYTLAGFYWTPLDPPPILLDPFVVTLQPDETRSLVFDGVVGVYGAVCLEGADPYAAGPVGAVGPITIR
jgi:signal transduction histidine kinase